MCANIFKVCSLKIGPGNNSSGPLTGSSAALCISITASFRVRFLPWITRCCRLPWSLWGWWLLGACFSDHFAALEWSIITWRYWLLTVTVVIWSITHLLWIIMVYWEKYINDDIATYHLSLTCRWHQQMLQLNSIWPLMVCSPLMSWSPHLPSWLSGYLTAANLPCHQHSRTTYLPKYMFKKAVIIMVSFIIHNSLANHYPCIFASK